MPHLRQDPIGLLRRMLNARKRCQHQVLELPVHRLRLSQASFRIERQLL